MPDRPKLAVFPKAFMDALCVTGSMTLEQWIRLAATLDVDGVELYGGFLDLQDKARWPAYREMATQEGLAIPMLCCSPDFCHADVAFRQRQVIRQKYWIDMTAALGGHYCRVLSGQRRPGIGMEEGLALVADAIYECLEYAEKRGITLTLENHYKDNYWTYPEFAQSLDAFLALIDRIDHPSFGVNFDPSNALLIGEDPLVWLRRTAHHVVTMHASDRHLASGTLKQLQARAPEVGYASELSHGVIGQGLNDYDAIFALLRRESYCTWISIEDGLNGMAELRQSVEFVRSKMRVFWP